MEMLIAAEAHGEGAAVGLHYAARRGVGRQGAEHGRGGEEQQGEKEVAGVHGEGFFE